MSDEFWFYYRGAWLGWKVGVVKTYDLLPEGASLECNCFKKQMCDKEVKITCML